MQAQVSQTLVFVRGELCNDKVISKHLLDTADVVCRHGNVLNRLRLRKQPVHDDLDWHDVIFNCLLSWTVLPCHRLIGQPSLSERLIKRPQQSINHYLTVVHGLARIAPKSCQAPKELINNSYGRDRHGNLTLVVERRVRRRQVLNLPKSLLSRLEYFRHVYDCGVRQERRPDIQNMAIHMLSIVSKLSDCLMWDFDCTLDLPV